MELDHTFNFNDPIEATAIFRAPNNSGGANEFGGHILFNWEDIKMVEEYMYPDDWVKYAGPKYFLTPCNQNLLDYVQKQVFCLSRESTWT